MAMSLSRYPLRLSIAAALINLAMKSAAYWLTGSVGLLSDAVESTVNLVAALTASLCLWYSSQPVDPSHTYGHEKIEYFSSGLEGMLIFVAAIGIAWVAVVRLFYPQPLEGIGAGAALALGASAVNFAVARVLLRAGRDKQSILLEADGQHLLADVWTSLGVVTGLLVAALSGWQAVDPLIALVVALYIGRTALDLIIRSFNGLMDHALPDQEQAALRAAIDKTLGAEVTYHALRTRRAGSRRFVDFHLLVPGAWSVQKAHDLTEHVEEAVKTAMPGIEVTVHIEPIEEPAAWQDSELLPLEQGHK